MEPITVTCFCHKSCCLPYVTSLPSDINISQGSVATPLRCDGISNDLFIATFPVSAILKIGQYLVKLWTRVWRLLCIRCTCLS